MGQLKQIKVRIVGTQPIIMHSGELADPIAPCTVTLKRLCEERKAKKKQGDPENEMEVARAEWNGGLWYDDMNEYPILPSDAIEGAIRDGAKATKRGKAAAAGVRCVQTDGARLLYDGPTKRKAMFDAVRADGRKSFVDRRGVVIGKVRVIRTRPRFNQWACDFTIQVDTGTIASQHVRDAIVEAGIRCGIGDYRPSSPKGGKFGLFVVEKFEVVD
jgi:hypothetical protein